MIIVDSMLGKLSRYLRMIGYDVDYVRNDKGDSYVIERSRGNLVLTRDKELHGKITDSILIKSYTPLEQLNELSDRLPKPEHKFMELCTVCGSVLEKTDRRDDLPPYVNRQAKEVFHCKNCDKFFWNGSHTDNFRRMMEGIGLEILQ